MVSYFTTLIYTVPVETSRTQSLKKQNIQGYLCEVRSSLDLDLSAVGLYVLVFGWLSSGPHREGPLRSQ